MVIAGRPPMSPKELEKVLKHLPEPTEAEVRVYGSFDYSSITRQAEEIVGRELREKLEEAVSHHFYLRNPTKEMILKLYRESWRKDLPTSPLRKGKVPTGTWFEKAYWNMGEETRITVTPSSVLASYVKFNRGCHRDAPYYIHQIGQELAKTDVDFRVSEGRIMV